MVGINNVYRPYLLVFGTVAVILGIFMIFLLQWLPYVIIWLLLSAVIIRVATRRIDEPKRQIIMRWGNYYKLGQSGLTFLIPGVDALGDTVDITPHSHKFGVDRVIDSDGNGVGMELELVWQIDPDIDLIKPPIKLMLMRSPEQQLQLIEQEITVIARKNFNIYATEELKNTRIRQSALETLKGDINDALKQHGIVIVTLFWRSSSTHDEIAKAQREVTIAHERVKGLLGDIQAIQQTMPSMPTMSPEQFLAYQTYLELLKRGMPLPSRDQANNMQFVFIPDRPDPQDPSSSTGEAKP
jgi:SPFH domain / Band 7 family